MNTKPTPATYLNVPLHLAKHKIVVGLPVPMCETEKPSVDIVKQEENLLDTYVGNITSLHSVIELIIHQRELRTECIIQHGFDDSLVKTNNTFWSDLFSQTFLSSYLVDSVDGPGDDLLFYVQHQKQNEKKPELSVFRKNSPNLPKGIDGNIDWEETVYLNLLMQYFVYILTVAKFTQTVYASPSHRKMDVKGSYEQIVYPDLYFTIDNYEEAFSDCILRDSECLNVELTAYDRAGQVYGVCFLGTISYSTLKQFYDSCNPRSNCHFSNHCHQRNNRMTRSFYSYSSSVNNNNNSNNNGDNRSVQFMRVIGPQAKGLAEIAIKPVKSDYIIEQQQGGQRKSLDLMLPPSAASSKSNRHQHHQHQSDFIMKCCHPVCLSQSDIDVNSNDNLTLKDMNINMVMNETYHSEIVTKQPFIDSHKSTSLLNFYDSISRINSKCSELITHGQDNTYMDPLPTLYPSPWSVKSAGASVHTSPVRLFKRSLGGNKCSVQSSNQHESSPIFSRKCKFKSTNAIDSLNESKPSKVLEIFNAFSTTKQSLSPCGGVGDNSGNHRTKSVKKNNSINQFTNANGDDDGTCREKIKNMNITRTDSSANHFYENPLAIISRDKSSFGQAWCWFKERRKATSIGLNASPTFITLPCQSILIDLLEIRREPILNFTSR
uniref:Uncharacterized protein n=1 Tax=Trichobilharzia regenti TaxID=157069 RepID=A0AA85ILP6_TRIRE|nr:unnamed protein product [Trichobilharzia regenti]